MTQKQIAKRRACTASTARTLLSGAYRKLGVSSGAQAVATMTASGWLDMIDTSWEDERITAGQSLYLGALLRWLRKPTDQAADERALWLRGMYYERRLTPPWESGIVV